MTDTLQRHYSDLETLRRLVAQGEQYMTPRERLDWRRRVAYYRLRTKEHNND